MRRVRLTGVPRDDDRAAGAQLDPDLVDAALTHSGLDSVGRGRADGVRRRPIIGARAPAKEGFLSGGRDNPGRGAKTTLDDADEVVPLLD